MAPTQTAQGLQPTVGDKVSSSWWPGAESTVTQLFGVFEAILGINAPHTGIDFSLPAGTELRVPQGTNGTVSIAGADDGYGNAVMLTLTDGTQVLLGHMKDVAVTVGQVVGPGVLLGHVDSTGLSTGNHVHFEVRQNGVPINPWPWVEGALGAVTHVTSGVPNPLSGLENVNNLAGSVSRWATDAKNWWRILFYLLGGGMVVAGLWIYLRPSTGGGSSSSTVNVMPKQSPYKTTPVPKEDTEAISASDEASTQAAEAGESLEAAGGEAAIVAV